MPFTEEFYNYVQTWTVVIVWDKDHTMVDHNNILRPKLENAILNLKAKYPTWKHVILTENNLDSIYEMFDHNPKLEPIFDLLLCDDNYFSRPAIRSYFIKKGYWWLWGRRIRKERARRKKRRVNDIFLSKKVVLIDDLRDGHVPEHSFCVTCKIWTGETSHEDEINWPNTLEKSILRVLKSLYHYSPKSIL